MSPQGIVAYDFKKEKFIVRNPAFDLVFD